MAIPGLPEPGYIPKYIKSHWKSLHKNVWQPCSIPSHESDIINTTQKASEELKETILNETLLLNNLQTNYQQQSQLNNNSNTLVFDHHPQLETEYTVNASLSQPALLNHELTHEGPLLLIIAVTVYYFLILLVAVVGNTTTCVIIARHKHMHTVTNCYLFSLAISDLLLLVSGLPPELYDLWSRILQVFGEPFCLVEAFISEMSTNATVFTITALTVERFLAICYPFHTHKVSTPARALKFIAIIWILSVCLAVLLVKRMGQVLIKDYRGNIIVEYTTCNITNYVAAIHYFSLSTVISFVLPMALITLLYVLIAVRLYFRSPNTTEDPQPQDGEFMICSNMQNNSTNRIIWMLVAVVAVFFICWTPYHMLRLYVIYGYNGGDLDTRTYTVLRYVSGIFFSLSTAINPVLYSIMSVKFRQAFKTSLLELMGSFRRRVQQRYGVQLEPLRPL